MKHSKECFQKHKSLKKLKDDKVPYKPNVEEAWIWFHLLNKEIFGNLLKPVEKIFISDNKEYGDVYALYHYDGKKRKQPSKISLSKEFKNEKMFVEVLAHEMIHHFQYTYNEPVGHGPSFLAWRENLALKGLKLYKVA